MNNAYPELPVVPYFNKKVEMGVIINAVKQQLVPVEIKRSAYIILRNETGNGDSVVNATNAAGVQSDGDRWPTKWDKNIVATTIKKGNYDNGLRGFVVFDTIENSIAFLCERIQARGLYIGGFAHKFYKKDITDVAMLCEAYYYEWVHGQATPKPTVKEIQDFESMYSQAAIIFVSETVDTVTVTTPQGGNVNVRAGAGTNYQVLTSLAAKTVCNIVERGTAWTKVRVKGIEGWIINDYLK